jgi:hypothetical protein
MVGAIFDRVEAVGRLVDDIQMYIINIPARQTPKAPD